ncbi:cytochrome P450 [Lasiosphaeria miniovina]|uniref:Cytochrome P450 n=1 Tax=Lasiosphaeria miniovina TaxID=1954250 RepID=A0AA40B6R7_9PEZI|nr:cytochrome P450 [Lasiosphaeria miniovina]KAK0728731.1 cytochrome P450 [Lasiosphaeria miniovina]
MAWIYVLLLVAAPLLLTSALVLQTAWCLLRNYASTRTIGVPIRFIPISPPNPFWVLADRTVLSLVRRLPGPLGNNKILNVFGLNISTAEGQAWKTQRKIAQHCFNEQNNAVVWDEALTLARDMLKYWTSKPSVDTAAIDLGTMSLHVLSRAGFGKSFKFESQEDRMAHGSSGTKAEAANYKESLLTVVENCILIVCLDVKDGGGLTEAEIYGNMFVFNFAGHDTTAHTFTFAIYFLAAISDVQEWLSEEINHVCGHRAVEEWNYRADFPRLKRCLSVKLETIRLYSPVPVLKWTADKSQPLLIGGKTLVIPPHSMIVPSYGSVHTDPRFWGPDSLSWNPSRFITKSSANAEEEFCIPVRGSFVGFSDGPQDCPGRKFAQVELVATMAVLFGGDWRVESAPKYAGEGPEAARRRVLDLIESDSGPVLLL